MSACSARMLSLRDTQAAILAAIVADDAAPALRLVREDGLAADQRLQIYRNNHRLGSLAALQATYPVIERLGGADWFAQRAAQYVRRFPSRSGDLQNLGGEFAGFLRTDLAGTAYTYFADVAELEWAYQLVLTAEERAPADLGVLRAVAAEDYERLLFVPRPAVRLVQSPYPLLAIWQANQPGAAAGQAEIRLDAGAARVLLIRRTQHVELRNLSAGGYRLLQQFQLGVTLGAAVEAIAADFPGFDLQTCLNEVLALEAIADIELDDGRSGQQAIGSE